MAKTIIATPDAPKALGPYSQGVKVGNLVFTSGQLGLTPAGDLPETIEEQTRQALENIQAILKEAGTDMSKVVKTVVYLADVEDFVAMNGVYGEFFAENSPARGTLEAARLPKDALIEIEAIAEVE
jgi:2-iminobutanoate/2-iminopropanoate deaminase